MTGARSPAYFVAALLRLRVPVLGVEPRPAADLLRRLARDLDLREPLDRKLRFALRLRLVL